jgi:hypothetical protein
MQSANAMIKITESTEKEFYYSQKLKDFRGDGTICYINGKEYNFAVLKGTKTGIKIVDSYKKKYKDVKLVFRGASRNCKIEVKRKNHELR